jgi:uncharacterized membrane protein HdeD (DUF308 family)
METLLESKLWKFALTWGALSVVLGALILAWPGTSILVASTMFGVYLLVSGFVGVAMSFTLPESAGMRVMLFISGALSVILAVFCFRNFGDPYPIWVLSVWIGVGFMIQGFSLVAVAISYKELPARGWYAVLGVLSVIAGGVVIVYPWDSIVVLTLATGIWLVVMGVVQIVQGFVMRNDSKTIREAGNVVRERFEEVKDAAKKAS